MQFREALSQTVEPVPAVQLWEGHHGPLSFPVPTNKETAGTIFPWWVPWEPSVLTTAVTQGYQQDLTLHLAKSGPPPTPSLWMPLTDSISPLQSIPRKRPGEHPAQAHPWLLFLVPPHITHLQEVFPPKLNPCLHRNGAGGWGGPPPRKGTSSGGGWEWLAGSAQWSFPPLPPPPPRPLREQHVPPTVIFNAFILMLNLSCIVILFSQEHSALGLHIHEPVHSCCPEDGREAATDRGLSPGI